MRGQKYFEIDMKQTGKNIKYLMQKNGIRPVDIQIICGFTTPNTVYRWYKGESLPTVDNLAILAQVLNVTMDEIIILDKKSI